MHIYYPFPEKLPDLRARFIQTLNTCRGMAEAGARVTLLAGLKPGTRVEDIPAFYHLEPSINFTIKPLPMLRGDKQSRLRLSWHGLFNFSLLFYLLKKRLGSGEPGLVYVRHLKLAEFLIGHRKILNMPVVYEVHELFHQTTENPGRKEKVRRREIRVLKGCDALVCTSRRLKEMVVELGAAGPVQVASNGFRSDWKIDRDVKGTRIFYAGSLYPWKGVDTLIDAATRLPDQNFLIVGGGGRLEELKEKASRLAPGRIEFTGPVPHEEMPQRLSRAGIAVLPNIPDISSQFSSPLKLFEYMAFGLPIVASDIPIFREILNPGQNALLFTPGDPESLARAIRRLIDDPDLRAGIAATARKDAENYTYEKRAERIIGLLGRLGRMPSSPSHESDG